jgi:hypothetical protein
MLDFTSGRFRSINSDQLATPTDRALSGRVQQRAMIPPAPRGSVPIIDDATGEIIRYRPRDPMPFGAKLLVFMTGMMLGMGLMFFSIWL